MAATTLPPRALPLIDERSKALFSLGWIKPSDGFFAAINVICLWAIFSWSIFGHPSVWQLLGLLIFMVLACQVWTILVLYRVALFVLEFRSDIHMLPETVATIMMDRAKANIPV